MSELNELTPQVWVVDQETWDWINDLLERPPRDIPKLKELMSRKPPWDTDEHQEEQRP